MTTIHTIEENKTWLAKQPKKLIVVKAIIRSNHRNLLLLKSAYKGSGQLLGGGVDASESPEVALKREIQEELSLVLSPAS